MATLRPSAKTWNPSAYAPRYGNKVSDSQYSRASSAQKWLFGCLVSSGLPWLSRLDAGLSPFRSSFNPRPVYVRFMVDNVSLGQVALRVLRCCPLVSSILLHSRVYRNTTLIRTTGKTWDPSNSNLFWIPRRIWQECTLTGFYIQGVKQPQDMVQCLALTNTVMNLQTA
jgi:hypothetical protein